MENLVIRPVNPSDKEWLLGHVIEQWGSEIVIAHGVTYRPVDLAGFVAVLEAERVGLITYHIVGGDCEIVSLDSLRPSMGIGTKLIEAVKEVAYEAECKRVWLITTNDNVHALGFYQKRGFVLVALHRNAVDVSRKLKPEIPKIGAEGIPIRDEIELELILESNKQ
jgi:ribosomal protein S18 acetylase RimI-like enzyme